MKFHEPRCYFFWVHLGSGRCWSNIVGGQRLAQVEFLWTNHGLNFFRKSSRKQTMHTKNVLEHAKNTLTRPGQLWTQRLLRKMWTQLLIIPNKHFKSLFQENEGVVENVLNDHGDEWELIDANERISGFLEANKALSISVEPIKAATNGFFVALFRRK